MPRKKKSVRVVSSPRKASNRPAKLRNWRDEAMTGAIEAVKGGMGVNHAAKEFGVPTTTLRDRLSGPVTHGTNPGPKPYLSSQEEGELTEYLASTSKAGYGKTRQQVMNVVQHVATRVGTGARVLTSAKSMRLLEEKEAQKRREPEEKEQWRLERKEKKEEEKKQKAEARVLKAAEKHTKQGEKGRRGPKRKAPSGKGDSVNNENGNGAEPVRKKARVVNERAHETFTIDINQCCVCFIHYQDDVAEANGRNWIACSCGHWLHEDCSLIEPEMIPTSEEFCPNCVL